MIVRPLKGTAVLERNGDDGKEVLHLPLREMNLDPSIFPNVARFLHPYVPEWKILKREELKIRVQDGIGDLHWTFLKLQTLRDLCGARRIVLYKQYIPPKADYYKRADRADDFLAWNPTVTETRKARELVSLPECGFLVDEMGYDYVLDPTRVMEAGKPFSDWLPMVPINYNYKMNWPDSDKVEVVGKGDPVVYMGNRYAEVTWAGPWGDWDWSNLIVHVGELTKKTVNLVGLVDDAQKASVVEGLVKATTVGGTVRNLCGKTSLSQVLSLIAKAPLFVGACSGLSIIAAARGVRSLALWPDETALTSLPKSMRADWLPAGVEGRTHLAVGYGEGWDAIRSKIGLLWGERNAVL